MRELRFLAFLFVAGLVVGCSGAEPEEAAKPVVEKASDRHGTISATATPEGTMVFVQQIISGGQNSKRGKQGSIFPEERPRIKYIGKVPASKLISVGRYQVWFFHHGSLKTQKIEVIGGRTTEISATLGELHQKEMVLVPAATYRVGRDLGEPGEGPAHDVNLAAYYVDRNMVANERYHLFEAYCRDSKDASFNHPDDDARNTHRQGNRLIVGHDGKAQFFSAPERPTGSITWYDAYAYAGWAGKRLLTEAEWEVAAGWNPKERRMQRYPWGDDPDEKKAYISTKKNKHASARIDEYPKDVSPFGCHQMAGNLMEWTLDWYSTTYYANAPVDNPQGPKVGGKHKWKVVRGGCGNFFFGQRDAARYTTYARKKFPIGFVNLNIGFRCARTAGKMSSAHPIKPGARLGARTEDR